MTATAGSKNNANRTFTADVAVIGAGPGGSTAAKNCAKHGLHTILLEKAKTPRYKCCLRRFPDNMTRTLIASEYGPTPDWVLTDPPAIFYLARGMSPTEYGKEPELEPQLCPHMFSTECDYWMNLKAQQAGAEIWDEALVTHIDEEPDGVTVLLNRKGEKQRIKARYLVGADGAMSTTRKCLFPNLNPPTLAALQEFYPGSMSPLDRKYTYTFQFDPPQKDMFHIVHKKNCFHIDVDASARPVRESMALAKKTMSKMWGFDPDTKPLWSAGTVMVLLLGEVLSGKFVPARGNILLVGEAASLEKPSDVGRVGGTEIWFGGGGVGLAVKTGILAAQAIKTAADTSAKAADVYVPKFEQVASVIREMASNLHAIRKGNWREHDKYLDRLI